MITKKEFQEALKIVNSYIEQLNNDIIIKENIVSDFSKTNILEWIKEKTKQLPKITNNHTRLFNVLKSIYKSEYNDKLEFIEDVKEVELSRYRGSSDKIQVLFDELYSMDSYEADA